MKQMPKIKRIIIEQERDSLAKFLQEIKKIEPCSNIKAIASIISLEGQNVLSPDDSSIIEDLKRF